MNHTRPRPLPHSFAPVIVAGLAGALLLQWPHLAPAYLATLLFVVSLPLGAAFVLLTWRLTGGDWGRLAARPCLSLLRLTWLIIPLALPLVFVPHDYHPPPTPWMSTPAVLTRTALALIAWTFIAHALTRPSRPTEGWAGVALIVLLMTTALAAVDWVLPLTPHVTSSIFGLIVAATTFTNALAFGLLAAARRTSTPRTDPPLRDLASLLLVAIVLEGYLHLAQFMIIWNGDLPHQVTWYAPRLAQPWGWLSLIVITLRFLLPLPALVLFPCRRSANVLRATGALVLASGVPLALWMTLPSVDGAEVHLLLVALVMLGILLTAAVFAWGAVNRETHDD